MIVIGTGAGNSATGIKRPQFNHTLNAGSNEQRNGLPRFRSKQETSRAKGPILMASRPFEPCENRQAASARKLSIFSQMVGDQSNSTAGRSCSGDRTRSPEQSPENGNISGCGGRLSAISALYSRKRDPIDRCQKRKSPPLAGVSLTVRGDFSERRTAWLGWEDSNLHLPVL
jgi:hypothetical protein